MEAYLVHPDQPVAQTEATDTLPESGFLWLDFVRDEARGWQKHVKRLTGKSVMPQHVTDSLNSTHVSFFDGTPDYDMVIFQGLGPENFKQTLSTRTAVFFLFDRLLVTIHASDSLSFDIVKKRFEQGEARSHRDPVGLTHRILDTMVDRYLQVRGPMQDELRRMIDGLLDPKDPFNDHQLMLDYGRRARKLNTLSSTQLEALDSWRRNARVEFSDSQVARLTDLEEHVGRILRQAETMQGEIEAAVQLHFAATAHRTNEIVQTLTVISAIFLPLSLVAGIFGMNFEYMPELKFRYAYFMALGGMAALAIGLLVVFKRKGYF